MQKEGGSKIFDIFSTKKTNRNRWLEHQGKRVALQERWQSDWQDVIFEGTMAKAPPKDEDAAEFFVSKGGRKPVEFCGR